MTMTRNEPPSLIRRFDRTAIATRVAELGREIVARSGEQPLVCVGVLPGSILFLADLVRCLPVRVEIDFVSLRPVDPARAPAPGQNAFTKDLETDIAGRDVLLVDDLLDSGRTMAFLVRTLATRSPASLRVCAFLDRPDRRLANLPVAHTGYTVGDELLIGYGIELDGWFRSCGEIWEVIDPVAIRADPLAALRQMSRSRPVD
jgi:hypoxanthine phosphoribosyltransferase